MHRVFFHFLFLSVVFFERWIGCLCICVFCSVIFCGEGAAPPPQMHWVSLHVLFFFVIFLSSSSSCDFLHDVLGSNVAVRGGNLKQKKAGGGLGGRAQRLPPRCIGCLCMCCFFSVIFVFFFLCFFFPMFLEAMWQVLLWSWVPAQLLPSSCYVKNWWSAICHQLAVPTVGSQLLTSSCYVDIRSVSGSAIPLQHPMQYFFIVF